jgi:hypothetical protein
MIQIKGKIIFTLLVLAYVGIILYFTLHLGRTARMVPLIVIIPTLALLVLQVLLDIVPGFGRMKANFGKTDIYRVVRSKEKIQEGPEISAEKMTPIRSELSVLLWALIMLFFIYLFGLIIALLLYIFIHLKKRSNEGWIISIAMAATTSGLLCLVLFLLPHSLLYKGNLWIWLGF